MRMARVNIYLPDELANDARLAGLNVSALTQVALRGALDARRTNAWLHHVLEMKDPEVDLEAVLAAVRAAADEFGQGAG